VTREIDQQISEIITVLEKHPEGLPRGQIAEKLSFSINDKTLQRRLATLASEGKITRTGARKATLYYPVLETVKGHQKDNLASVFSPQSQEILKFIDIPLHRRDQVSYDRDFLNSYVPNESAYVPKEVRDILFKEGKRFDDQLAAGTYAQHISQRLLIDLSYNSSRLEGNTYSRLDTQLASLPVPRFTAQPGSLRKHTFDRSQYWQIHLQAH